jgi:hypothetical protein
MPFAQKYARNLTPGQHFVSPNAEERAREGDSVSTLEVISVHLRGEDVHVNAVAEAGFRVTHTFTLSEKVLFAPKPPVLIRSFHAESGQWVALVSYAGPLNLSLNDATVFDGDTEA